MNVTMPAPAPTTPPAAAPHDRVGAREQAAATTESTARTTSTGRRSDDERTFEEQLDDVAVALGSTGQPERVEAHTKQQATTGTTATAPAVAAPLASTAPVPQALVGELPTATPLAAPTLGTGPVVALEIEGPRAPLAPAPTTQAPNASAAATAIVPTTASAVPAAPKPEPTATGTLPTTIEIVPTTTGLVSTRTPDAPTPTKPEPTATLPTATPATPDAPTPTKPEPTATLPTATPDAPTPTKPEPTATLPTATPATPDAPTPTKPEPTATGTVPTTIPATTTTAGPVTTSDSDAQPPLTPLAPQQITMPAAPDSEAGPTTPQATLDAMSALALDADIDAQADARVDSVAGADAAGADVTTPPALVNLAPSVRRNDASAAAAGTPAALIAEAADELAPPIRLAPPRTIAVELNDEGLGPLRVVATAEQRTVHLTVSAGEAIVRDALVRQQADLRHDLADAGLQLGSFEVDARTADRDHTDQPAATSDGGRDRPTARSAAGPSTATRIHDIHDADGHLDLRL